LNDIATELRRRIRYYDGHSDTSGMLADGAFLRRLVAELAEPFRHASIDKAAGIEARGLALAAGVALELGGGFVPVRKVGGAHPGALAEALAAPDWRGHSTTLRVQRHALLAGERVLLVDDWAETGSKALAARELIERCGATYSGFAVVVDQLPPETRARLAPVHALVTGSQVTPDQLIYD
jgi:adenine phosphoribosyltransferase